MSKPKLSQQDFHNALREKDYIIAKQDCNISIWLFIIAILVWLFVNFCVEQRNPGPPPRANQMRAIA